MPSSRTVVELEWHSSTLKLEASWSSLEKLCKGMCTLLEGMSSSRLSRGIIRIIAVVKSCSKFCNKIESDVEIKWKILYAKFLLTWIREYFICFIDSSHFIFASAFIWMCRLCGFSTKQITFRKKISGRGGSIEDLLGFLDGTFISIARDTQNFIIVLLLWLLEKTLCLLKSGQHLR